MHCHGQVLTNTAPARGMGWDGMGWDGMGWEGMGGDGRGEDMVGRSAEKSGC